MSRNTKLCPFRKVIEQEWSDETRIAIKRERFRPCIGHKCMAYVYTAPLIKAGSAKDPANWGCARMLSGRLVDIDVI